MNHICLKHVVKIKEALEIGGVSTMASHWQYYPPKDSEDLERKKGVFREKTKTKKAIFLTLITPYGATKNMHYLGSVQNQLTLDCFFKR